MLSNETGSSDSTRPQSASTLLLNAIATPLPAALPPIVMADAFYGIGEDGCARSGLTVCEDNIFVEEGALSECGLIEHIAQSAALRAGYMDRSRGEKVRLGYIGAVNDLKVHALPPVGSRLVTTIAVEQAVMNVTLLSARTECGGKPVAECRMKIYMEE